MPKADDIFVQVGVDLPRLNSDLTKAEKRADTTASRLKKAFTLSDSSLGGRQAWLGGLSVVGGMLALGRGLNNYLTEEKAGFGVVGDFVDAIARATPVLGEFYEVGKKLAELNDPDMAARYSGANLLRERLALETASLSGDPVEVLRAKQELAKASAQAAYMQTLAEIATKAPVPELRSAAEGNLSFPGDPGNQKEVEQAQALRNRLEGYAKQLMEAQVAAADRMTLEEKKAERKEAREDFFDSVGTVFGQFKVPRQNIDKMAEIDKNTEQAVKLLTDIRSFVKMLGNVGRPFN